MKVAMMILLHSERRTHMKVVENKQKENDIELKINAVCGAGC